MADNLETKRIHVITKIATEDLLAHRFVQFTSGSREAVEYPAAQYDTAQLGVTLHRALAGQPVEIGVAGWFPVQVDGAAVAIVAGDAIGVHNDTGYGQDVTGAASRAYFATALEGTTTDGDIIICAFPGARMLTTA